MGESSEQIGIDDVGGREDALPLFMARVSELPCACETSGSPCLRCTARVLVRYAPKLGKRPMRNNPSQHPYRIVHKPGFVETEREPRPGCPLYITDRRQRCSRCRITLAHGKWALFFAHTDVVTTLYDPRTGLHHSPTIAPAEWREMPILCESR